MANIFKKTDERYQSTDAKLLWTVSRINAKKTKTSVSPGHCSLHFLWTFLSLDAFRKSLWSHWHPVVIRPFCTGIHLPPSWASMIPHGHLTSPLKTATKSERKWDEVHRHHNKLHGPMFLPSPPGCMSSHEFYIFRSWSIPWGCLTCPRDLYRDLLRF